MNLSRENESSNSLILDLQRKIGLLQDREEIYQLKAAYLRLMDKLALESEKPNAEINADNLTSLFCDDCMWCGGDFFGSYKGRESVKNFFKTLAGAAKYTKHVTMNPEIEINGDTASGIWQLVVLAVNLQGGEGMWKGGNYKDIYVKDQNGRWKISSTEVKVERIYYEKCGGDFDYSGRVFGDGVIPISK